MTTTTLRIDDRLRERIARIAQALEQAPHNFMLEALAQKADESEWKLAMLGEARQRDAAIVAGEPVVEWHEMRAQLQERLQREPSAKAKLRRR